MAPRRASALGRTSVSGEGTDAATLRDHLVAATDRLLDAEGLGALTTRRIAEHAGVSDGVLYNHFADKRDLVLAALLRRYTRLVEGFEARLPAAGEGNLGRNLRAYARALRDLEADALVIGAGLLTDPVLLGRFWTTIHDEPFGLDRLRQPLADYLEAERAAGRTSPDADLRAVTSLVFGATAMNALTRRLNPGIEAAHIDESLDRAVELIARAIAPAPPADD